MIATGLSPVGEEPVETGESVAVRMPVDEATVKIETVPAFEPPAPAKFELATNAKFEVVVLLVREVKNPLHPANTTRPERISAAKIRNR